MLNNGIYRVFMMSPQGRHPAARFVVSNGLLHTLEDYHDVLGKVPAGLVTEQTVQALMSLPEQFKCVSDKDFCDGKHPDLIPEADLPPFPQTPTESQPLAIWSFQNSGEEPESVVEHHGDKFYRDGAELSLSELHQMLDSLKNGGKLKYKEMNTLNKREDEFDSQSALAHLENKHGHDPESKAALDKLRRDLFGDSMNPSIGNKHAYNQWIQKPREGIHIGLDLNNLKSINDTHGHAAGDEAIKAFSGAVRDSMDEVMKPIGQTGKVFRAPHEQSVFRPGGDEFSAWVPSHEHALQFTRALRNRLDQMQPINGTHKISTSIGMGADPQQADKSLYEAKKQKKNLFGLNKYKPHNIPSVLMHSLYGEKQK